MNKRDYIITGLVSTYIVLFPLVSSSAVEWILYTLLIAAGIISIYEVVKYDEYKKDITKKVKHILFEKFSLMFIGLIMIMAFSSIYADNKMAAIKEAIRFATYGYIYFLIRFRINKERMHEYVIKIHMAGVFFVSLIGVLEFVKNYSKDFSLDYILNHARIESTLGHANAFGGYIILALFPAIVITLRSKGKEKIPYAILSIMLMVNLALTFSRNAWLAFAIGILLLTIIYSWRFIFLCVIPIIFVTLSPNIMMRVQQLRETGLNEGRLRLWKIAEKMVSEHFFLGVGGGNYIYAYKEYVKRFPEFKIVEAETLPPHNAYIKTFTELGIVGAMVFLLMCFEILRKLYEIRKYTEGKIGMFYDGFLISATCFLIMNCFDDLFFVPKIATVFILFVSIAFVIESNNSEEGNDSIED